MDTSERVTGTVIPQLLRDFQGYYSIPTGLLDFDYRRSTHIVVDDDAVKLFHPLSRKPFASYPHEEVLYFASVVAECESLQEIENLVDEEWRFLVPAALRALTLSGLITKRIMDCALDGGWDYYLAFNQDQARRSFYWLRYNLLFHFSRASKYILAAEFIESTSSPVIEKDPLSTYIYFATNRKKSVLKRGENLHFSTKPDNKINYGYTEVNVPERHVKGKLERLNLFKRHVGFDKSRYFHISEFVSQDNDEFWKTLKESSKKSVCIVYVHGFNVSFEHAILKAAQIKVDLETDIPMLAFSWPSQESASKYKGDNDRADAAAAYLAQVLSELPKQGFSEVLLMSHSMGAQCLSKALSLVSTEEHLSSRAVFSAPDITASHFRDRYEDVVRSTIKDTNIHVSNMDHALRFSMPVVDSEPRIGDCSNGVKVFDGMDTVDLSPCRSFFHLSSFSHNYSTKYVRALTDLRRFLIEGLPPQKRHLTQITTDKGKTYWKLDNQVT